jgi:hypothetical protein
MNHLERYSEDWIHEAKWYYKIMHLLGLLEQEEYNTLRRWL